VTSPCVCSRSGSRSFFGSADRAGAIFEPYERGERKPTQPDSIGLGLSVARDLARLMGGDLVYERRDDTTYFSLLLQRAGA